VQVAAQDAERQVAFEPQLTAIAAALQAVAGLQCADRGFDSRMTLTRGAKLDRGVLLLFARLLRAGLGQTGMGDDLRQRRLVLR
jgi:hypothetical protein